MPDALLDEVTALVELPAVYEATFDSAFLSVPQECLVLTMQQNQKYFALQDGAGKLLHRFLLVSNVETTDPQAIVEGNERVLRARLADARFFFDQDRKARLDTACPKLGLDRLSQQARHAARADLAPRRAVVGACRHDRRRSGAGAPRGRSRQSRSHHRHGR
jgi:hypothetical protein